MAIGDTVVSDGVTFEVIWAGGEGLVAPRQTRASETWEPPSRLYNKTGKYAKPVKDVDNPTEEQVILLLEDDE